MRYIFSVLLLVMSFTYGFSQNGRRSLTVSLYPIIPNADNFYYKIKTRFEKIHPDIQVQILRNADYYDEKSGIISDTADVLEVDCILLQDFIDKGLIQPIPASFKLNETDLMPATSIVNQSGLKYAVPHWLCGNFAFFINGDTALRNVKTLKNLESAIGTHPPIEGGILVDMYGKLTLGELYADCVMDEFMQPSAVNLNSDPNHINPIIKNNLDRLTLLKYSDWGRSSIYHEKLGFYPRQFAKSHGRVLVGYSESLYYVLEELTNACAEDEHCITAGSIDVITWPMSDKGNMSLGWVDGLVLKKDLSAAKLRDAISFIDFLLSKDGYELALIPDWGDVPRYLLPPFKSVYLNQDILKNAPLYKNLYPLALELVPVTGKNLCAKLRAIGKKLTKDIKP